MCGPSGFPWKKHSTFVCTGDFFPQENFRGDLVLGREFRFPARGEVPLQKVLGRVSRR